MTVTEPAPMSRTAAVAYAIGLPLALLAIVFLPVGRLDWSPGWFFVTFLIVVYGISALVLWRVNPVIYRARSRFQPGTERWDRILLALMLPAMVAEIPVATLDAGRMFWSVVPFSIVVLGYGLIAAGIALGAWAQAVNRFFEPGVRIQRERGQHVVTAGPYQFVRHPGYVSAIMIFIGVPFSLASWWALIPAAFASAILILRTSWEDALLRAELDGYADYVGCRRTVPLPRALAHPEHADRNHRCRLRQARLRCSRHRHRNAGDEELCRASPLALARPSHGVALGDRASAPDSGRDHAASAIRRDRDGGGRTADPGEESPLL